MTFCLGVPDDKEAVLEAEVVFEESTVVTLAKTEFSCVVVGNAYLPHYLISCQR